MAATDEYAGELTAADLKAWRDGDWVFVQLAGARLYRRLTRDRSFTRAQAVFSETRSPRWPRILERFVRIELAGDWKPALSVPSYRQNRIEVPITEGLDPEDSTKVPKVPALTEPEPSEPSGEDVEAEQAYSIPQG